MSLNLNRVELIGFLGRDPEIRSTRNGTQVANLSVATSETWRDRQSGERKERTEWHRVSCFGPLAEKVAPKMYKGEHVRVVGQLRTHQWTDKDGIAKYTTEIVVQGYDASLSWVGGKGQAGSQQGGGTALPPEPQPLPDDDIPF